MLIPLYFQVSPVLLFYIWQYSIVRSANMITCAEYRVAVVCDMAQPFSNKLTTENLSRISFILITKRSAIWIMHSTLNNHKIIIIIIIYEFVG